jgi:hypothetical protein
MYILFFRPLAQELACASGLSYLRLVLEIFHSVPPWHDALTEVAGRSAWEGTLQALSSSPTTSNGYRRACIRAAMQQEAAAALPSLYRHFMQQWGFRARDLLSGQQTKPAVVAVRCPVATSTSLAVSSTILIYYDNNFLHVFLIMLIIS